MQVTSEKSPEANLSRYKSYAWAPEGPDKPKDAILDQSIRAHLRDSLDKSSFVEAPPGTRPDFLVRYAIDSDFRSVVEPSDIGMGIGVPYWGGYMTVPPAMATYREGSLIVEFIDERSRTPFWRGVARTEIESERTVSEKVPEATQKIVSEYRSDESSEPSG
jgi:hypothetical protein